MMSFYLTETEKILVLAVATSLFLVSVIVTICVVSPFCTFHKWIFRSKKANGVGGGMAGPLPAKGSVAEQLLRPESKHFQLTVIPHYGTQAPIVANQQPTTKTHGNGSTTAAPGNSSKGPKNSSGAGVNGSIKSKGSGKKKNSLSTDSPPFVTNALANPGSVRITFNWEQVDPTSVKMSICIHEATELTARDYGSDPACYVVLELLILGGRMSKRRSSTNKVAATFKTATAKRSLCPGFEEAFTTAVLPKSVLKDGLLRIKLMDDERYANDVCLGELNLPIKDLAAATDHHRISYPLVTPKEYKGDLLFGFCYLPTSRRVTLTVFKANLATNVLVPNRNYYVRILMFSNGKLTKKKKTPTSEKLIWSDCETLTFELSSTATDGPKDEQITFMLVLSWSSDSRMATVSSPSSPETPETPDNGANGSRKDRHIGHYVLGQECWAEMASEPRKQFSKWAKLM